jgi:hypothetical protein
VWKIEMDALFNEKLRIEVLLKEIESKRGRLREIAYSLL